MQQYQDRHLSLSEASFTPLDVSGASDTDQVADELKSVTISAKTD